MKNAQQYWSAGQAAAVLTAKLEPNRLYRGQHVLSPGDFRC